MDKFERFFAALYLNEPDRVPVSDIILSPALLEKLLNKKTILGMEAFYVKREKVIESLVNIQVEGHKKLDLDAFFVFDFGGEPEGTHKRTKILDKTTYIDEWGIKWRYPTEPRMIFPMYVGGTLDDPENFIPPDPHLEGRMDYFKLVKKKMKDEMPLIVNLSDTFEWVSLARGLQRFLADFILNPKYVERLLNMNLDFEIELGKAYVDTGCDAILTGDDYASNQGPYMSLEMFRRFIKPRMKKFIDVFKKRGIPVIKHTDGNIEPWINDFIEVGFTGLNPIEPQSMDIEKIKQKYGDRICLLGNIDCTNILPYGSEDDVKKEVRECIRKTSYGGGHIITSSNSLHYYCKPENVITMVNEVKNIGKYPLQL